MKRIEELRTPLMGRYLLALFWLGFTGVAALLLAFRCVKTSSIAQAMDFNDIPLLAYVDEHYVTFYGVFAGLGLFHLAGLCLLKRSLWATRSGKALCGFSAGAWGLALAVSWFTRSGEAASPVLLPAGWLDGLWVGSVCAAAVLYPHALEPLAEADPRPGARLPGESFRTPSHWTAVYLLSTASVFLYALLEHLKFWNPERNGDFHYRLFFQAGEIGEANWVLYATSALFASLAGLAACLGYGIFRCLSRRGEAEGPALAPVDLRRLAASSCAVWAFSLMGPWLLKLYPEIRSEGAWMLPIGLIGMSWAALVPLHFVSGVWLKRDFDELCVHAAEHPESPARAPFRLRRSEYGFVNFLLFPVYPILRLFRCSSARGYFAALLLLAGGIVGGLTWLVNAADEWFDFDDWRGMLSAGLFPFCRVVLSLCGAYFVYLAARRGVSCWRAWRAWRGRRGGARQESTFRAGRSAMGVCLALLALGSLTLASWPFWGWKSVPLNVLARTYEFSDRHRFEIDFLHGLLDFDRDGYAALLHGSDADDGDPNIQGGGLPTLEAAALPEDAFTVRDDEKAKTLPNLVLLYLEGVTPRAIDAYGERKLSGGCKATPNLDTLAAEGARFTNARCAYPSTWDAWFAVLSGRFLRVTEMNSTRGFAVRYSRYNNLYKVLKHAGFTRWCHPDTRPYVELFVPSKERARNWEPEFDSEPTEADREKEIRRGDKRLARLLRFLDSVKEGERFFLSEHMSDTHFPWRRTSLRRAKELGFPDGLEFAEEDARLEDRPWDFQARYYQTITRMDAQVGALIAKLKARGLYERTMIVVVGDHGCQWFEHEHGYYVSHLYEQSLHIPLIVRMPGLPGGVVSGAPVLQMDLLPTIMERAGVRLANPDCGRPLPGRSLVPLLKGRHSDALRKLFQDRDMLLKTHYDMLGAIARFRYKLIFDRPGGTYLLFDLESDPGEMKNLADSDPRLLGRMMAKLRTLAGRYPAFLGGLQPAE